MKDEYVTLNKVQTHLITWGSPFDCDGQDVIVIITGNPGVADFYIEFGSELHKSTGLPLCVIGQAGHELVPDENSNILKGQEHLFDLKGQLQHKLELINNYVDKQSRLHLIGHSIGAWLILELFADNENLIRRTHSVNLLFPTLQRMAETKNGMFLNNVLRKFHVILILLLHLLCIFPETVLKYLIECYLKVQSVPLSYCKSVLKFLKPTVVEKVLFLGYNEMDTVIILNTNVLDKIKHLTNVIHSRKDKWAPLSYIEDLKVFQPQIQIKEVNMEHAFVLKSSESAAEMVSNFIRLKM